MVFPSPSFSFALDDLYKLSRVCFLVEPKVVVRFLWTFHRPPSTLTTTHFSLRLAMRPCQIYHFTLKMFGLTQNV